MEFIVKGYFYTDGDFVIRKENFDENFQNCVVCEYDEIYTIYFKTENRYDVGMFLRQLVTAFDVSSRHYYLLPVLYNMVNDIIEALNNEVLHKPQINHITRTLSGNYDGSELTFERIE